MTKIVLVCSAGMSTSLLMNKMEEYAQTIHLDLDVVAYPIAEVNEKGQDADVVFLGPQVRFNLNKVQQAFPDKPVEAINIQDYGMMNGKNVVKHALELLEKNRG
ncbi:PTS sugar transporter subunit IIB [Streptococcus merionis]|uniref:PTS system cellobiose-specific component IIB n=1 Tax=Streptococcus merionis TaxID=400065 RepID=A0A239SUW8_9STRE|nr:PTS sugar transporter subunit IIB [Streptococcus merionis]SNU89059.1 PTS system cellobiose-specific component IIB [Streptococcus merionis]